MKGSRKQKLGVGVCCNDEGKDHKTLTLHVVKIKEDEIMNAIDIIRI